MKILDVHYSSLWLIIHPFVRLLFFWTSTSITENPNVKENRLQINGCSQTLCKQGLTQNASQKDMKNGNSGTLMVHYVILWLPTTSWGASLPSLSPHLSQIAITSTSHDHLYVHFYPPQWCLPSFLNSILGMYVFRTWLRFYYIHCKTVHALEIHLLNPCFFCAKVESCKYWKALRKLFKWH